MMEEEGKSEKYALNKAYNECLPKIHKSCRRYVANYLILMRKIQDTEMYRKLMQTVDNLMDEDEYDLDEAVKQAVKQRKHLVDQLFPEKPLPDESENDESMDEESD